MTKLMNPVLTREDLEKLFTKKESKSAQKKKKKVDKKDDFEYLYKTCDRRITLYTESIKTVGKSKSIVITKKLPTLVKKFTTLLDTLEILNDTQAISRTSSVLKSLVRIRTNLKKGTLSKVSDLKAALKKTYFNAKKIELDEDKLKYLNKSSEAFTTALRKVKMPKNNSPVFTVEAPLLFVLNRPIDTRLKLKLEHDFKLEEVAKYTYIDAMFIVGKKSRLNPNIAMEEQINAIVAVLNKKLAGSVVPFHDVSINSGQYYIAWLIPENAAKSISDFHGLIEDYQILLSFNNKG